MKKNNVFEAKGKDAITIIVNGPPKSGKTELINKIKEYTKWSPANVLILEEDSTIETPKTQVSSKMVNKLTGEIVLIKSIDNTWVEYENQAGQNILILTPSFLIAYKPYSEVAVNLTNKSLWTRLKNWVFPEVVNEPIKM
jgi:hypothetical protein